MSEPRPVFLGGPLHGQDVPPDVVNSMDPYRAVETPTGLVSFLSGPLELQYVHYQPQKYRTGLTSDWWLEVMVWVDTRLCVTARTRLMLRLISARGWIGHHNPHGGTPDAQEHAQEQGNPVVEPVRQAQVQARREVEDTGRSERGH